MYPAPANVSVILSGALTKVNIGNAAATDLFLKDVTNNALAEGFKIGTTTVTWTVTDTSGNSASATQLVSVRYSFGGILQPINTDGSSIFKAGSTVPVKFNLTDSNGAYVSTATAKLTYSKVTDQISGVISEAVSTSTATIGNLFRYDPTANQYIFNLSTKGLSVGTYLLMVNLDDGMSYSVKISLK